MAHEDRPALLTRVISDALGSLQHVRDWDTPVTSSTAAAGATEAFSFPGERPVTPEVVREHNLNDLEYGRIVEMLGRAPTLTELGIFSRALVGALLVQALEAGAQARFRPRRRRWSRVPARTPACCACRTDGRWRSRSSRTTTRPPSSRTRARPPASAGSCATCSRWARARSRCSTPCGSGRSIVPRNRYLFAGVVQGVGDYGNCVGIPTLGGEVGFAPGYTGNPLVNAMCVGLLEEAELIRAAAHGVGNVLLCVGARTGRDGIHGASFASEELSEKSEARRPQVQVGDPFTEKLLLEASLELITSGLIVAIQDMGAAGLTSSSAEMAARGGVGVEIDTGLVPTREAGHDAVRDPALRIAGAHAASWPSRDRVPEIQAVCAKWELGADARSAR